MTQQANGQKNFEIILISAFLLTIAVAATIGLSSLYVIRSISHFRESAMFQHADELARAQQLKAHVDGIMANARGFILARDAENLEEMRVARSEFDKLVREFRHPAMEPEESGHLQDIEQRHQQLDSLIDQALDNKTTPPSHRLDSVERELSRTRKPLISAIDGYIDFQRARFERTKEEARQNTVAHTRMVISISLLSVALAAGLAVIVGRTLIRLHRQSVRAIRMRDDFVAVVSHDLKNPLSAISMSSSLLNRMLKTDEDRARFGKLVETIQEASERMKSMVGTILDLSRIDAGKLVMDLARCSPVKIVNGTAAMLKPIADSKAISLQTEFREPLPEVICDRERVSQVLSNLIGNAIKFCVSGGTVRVILTATEKEVLFQVVDNGPGIPSEQLPRLFERYWQARETAKKGTGLGLSIAKAIVLAHQGRIWAESEAGKGSTISFVLPVAAKAV